MYSPKIDEDLIPRLYRLARERKVPMTRFVNEHLKTAIERLEKDSPRRGRTGPAGKSPATGARDRRGDRGSTDES